MGFEWAATVAFIKDIWWFLSVPLALLAGLGMYYLRGQFPTKASHEATTVELKDSIKALSDRVAESDRKTADQIAKNERHTADRLAKLEGDVKQLPGRHEMQSLSDRVSGVERELAASVETTRGVEKTVNKIDHTLNLILAHLLKEKGVVP